MAARPAHGDINRDGSVHAPKTEAGRSQQTARSWPKCRLLELRDGETSGLGSLIEERAQVVKLTFS
jgi:hypothetical protein